MKIKEMLAARAAHKELERELSAYVSTTDMNDLDAILDRHDEEQAASIRRIIAAQRLRIPQPRRG